ncbi:cationic amino acid transporter 5 [Gossypium australe]|uniref:Cationic amino acid transporter 5 n=1 Tax=Gossypium australe TaxID=47621 RepID=A0A5B6UA63_9ROSI|nr:cationic amino acid transporter 5 [Gossypium australe]
MAVALLVRRYYITASSIGTSSDWRLRPHYWTGYIVTIPLWFLGTLGISIFCPAEDTNSLGASQGFHVLHSCQLQQIFVMGGNAGLLHFLSLHITYDVEYQQKMLSPEG